MAAPSVPYEPNYLGRALNHLVHALNRLGHELGRLDLEPELFLREPAKDSMSIRIVEHL